jgi:hypothetical protein
VSDFWLDRQTGKTTRLADYVLRTPGAVLVVPDGHAVRRVLQLRPAFHMLPTKVFSVDGLRRWPASSAPPSVMVVDDWHLMPTRDLRDIRLFCGAARVPLRFKVTQEESMQREMASPWGGQPVRAARCWCCHRDFTAGEPVRVVDATDPKLVHDREPCASAVIQMVQGQ